MIPAHSTLAGITFPLAMAASQMALYVSDVHGLDAHVKRLAELGLVKGVTLRVVSVSRAGVLVQTDGCRIAVDRDLANEVWVGEVRAA